jgi:hypothetical protein
MLANKENVWEAINFEPREKLDLRPRHLTGLRNGLGFANELQSSRSRVSA